VNHQQLKVVSSVENVMTVYQALFLSVLKFLFRNVEKWFENYMMAHKRANVTLNQGNRGSSSHTPTLQIRL
jgi:hypothetical protein